MEAWASPCLYRHGTKRLFTLALIYKYMYTSIRMTSELKPVRWIGSVAQRFAVFP